MSKATDEFLNSQFTGLRDMGYPNPDNEKRDTEISNNYDIHQDHQLETPYQMGFSSSYYMASPNTIRSGNNIFPYKNNYE